MTKKYFTESFSSQPSADEKPVDDLEAAATEMVEGTENIRNTEARLRFFHEFGFTEGDKIEWVGSYDEDGYGHMGEQGTITKFFAKSPYDPDDNFFMVMTGAPYSASYTLSVKDVKNSVMKKIDHFDL